MLQKSDYGFLLWVDENQMGDVEDNSREKEMLIEQLLNEKKIIEGKVQRLKKKRK